MRILVTGATGLIGSSLVHRLIEEGHQLVILSRDRELALDKLKVPCEAHAWHSDREVPPEGALKELEAVVHLAGEPIAAGRWTEERKRRIRESRVVSTRRLIDGLARATGRKPSIFICASAIGYYGDQGAEILTEGSSAGNDFLARICVDWEHEAGRGFGAPARRVFLRTGIVLSPRGGALAQLLPPFLAGVGGPIGRGSAWMSWIHLDDLVSIIVEALGNPRLEGPVNSVAPQPVTNREFSKALGRALDRPAIAPIPPLALKVIFGEMAKAILASQRALPEKLEKAGFRFRFETIEAALADLLPGERESPVGEFIRKKIRGILS